MLLSSNRHHVRKCFNKLKPKDNFFVKFPGFGADAQQVKTVFCCRSKLNKTSLSQTAFKLNDKTGVAGCLAADLVFVQISLEVNWHFKKLH